MTRASLTGLIPIAELTPGAIANIRNSVINQIVSMASKELSITEDLLIVRDIEPQTDLSWDYGAASAGTSEGWERDFTGTSVGYVSVTSSTMADQRWVAIFGVRNNRLGHGATDTATNAMAAPYMIINPVSFIKFEVGGAIRAIWDVSGLSAYPLSQVGFSNAAVVISQNAVFNIHFYQKNVASVSTAKAMPSYLQLLGVTVEPRGKVVSP